MDGLDSESEFLGLLADVLPAMRRRAGELDQSAQWPELELEQLAKAGAMRWAILPEFGGDGLSPLELYRGYETIASASLAVALILSQRDSAIGLIETAIDQSRATNGRQDAQKLAALLNRLARHQTFVTIGVAQLTTSRQGGPPPLLARPVESGYEIDGLIPWSTGAGQAEFVIAGAVLPDARQVLFLLPMSAPGVRADPPLPLACLRATWTGEVRCQRVMIETALVLKGPAEQVMGGRRNALTLGQAFLATGLCRGALELLVEHTSPTASSAAERFQRQLWDLLQEMLVLSQPGREAQATSDAPELRGRCIDLALRISHAAVALYKGTGLLAGHPAQRLAREALFLLVWSCPAPVIDCTVGLLSDG